ncbi:hypothetical protein SAMN02745163_02146 [Clostridium cavendishii DSM 21758]|uniref:Holin n=1 Tax=Clostridium cavendishii DSM 21758 TaxID=1121302 RepID=A0A1M6KAW4_9CLOT|nr:hypothetical protein [Clostridium cavendishii]SHJ56105.1 hypothetical protein SAMN02745163_02146 [Clostridium cavendishii DSM 21758]
MNGIASILVLAGISEAVWESLKMIRKDKKFDVNRIGAMIVGVLLCILTKADILSMVGFDVSIPIVGEVLTGLLISRGANFINDLYGSIYNVQCNTKEKNRITNLEYYYS